MRRGAALRATATGSDHAAAIRLAGAIWPLLGWRGCYEEQLTAARLGVRAARVSGDMVTEPRLHAGMGFVLRQLRRPGEAAGFCRAACLWLEAGRDDQFVAVLRELGHLSTARGRLSVIGRLGMRDRALVLFLYNTGARVQEPSRPGTAPPAPERTHRIGDAEDAHEDEYEEKTSATVPG